jgi:AraC-like DNA-binding protein
LGPIPPDDPIWHTLLTSVRFALADLDRAPVHEILGRVRQYVGDRLKERITLDDLADLAGMSRFHFVREFRRISGVSPMKFVCAARIDSAKTLLLRGDMPLRAIAPLVGFGDDRQLRRAFRRTTGISAGRFRMLAKSGLAPQTPLANRHHPQV